MKETDLAMPLKKLFEEVGYVVYSEVQGKWFTKRADMIVTNDDSLIAIELKTSLSFKVIDQARFWKKYADYVYVVVPKTKTKRSITAIETLENLGIGLIEVDLVGYTKLVNKENIDPKAYLEVMPVIVNPIKNKVTERNRKQFENLSEEHKTWAIGGSQSKGSKYVTGYSLLMNDVYAFLREQLDCDNEGWVTHNDIYSHLLENSSDRVKNHYTGKNPEQSLKQALIKFENEELETIILQNKWYVRILPDSTKYLNMGKD